MPRMLSTIHSVRCQPLWPRAVRACGIATLINASTREPFTYKDACVELNPHVGYDAAATEAVKTSVKQFLSTVFKL